jgi:hypothetical protein
VTLLLLEPTSTTRCRQSRGSGTTFCSQNIEEKAKVLKHDQENVSRKEKKEVVEIERGRTRSRCVQNWLERDHKPVARWTI